MKVRKRAQGGHEGRALACEDDAEGDDRDDAGEAPREGLQPQRKAAGPGSARGQSARERRQRASAESIAARDSGVHAVAIVDGVRARAHAERSARSVRSRAFCALARLKRSTKAGAVDLHIV